MHSSPEGGTWDTHNSIHRTDLYPLQYPPPPVLYTLLQIIFPKYNWVYLSPAYKLTSDLLHQNKGLLKPMAY